MVGDGALAFADVTDTRPLTVHRLLPQRHLQGDRNTESRSSLTSSDVKNDERGSSRVSLSPDSVRDNVCCWTHNLEGSAKDNLMTKRKTSSKNEKSFLLFPLRLSELKYSPCFYLPGVIIVEEDSDVILPCSLDSKENIVAALFDWKKVAQRDQGQKDVFFYDAGDHYNSGRDGQSPEFRGRVSHFPDQLNQGNASIIIRNMKVEDTGSYTCNLPRLRPPQTFSVELVVDRVLRDRSGDTGES
ncbi:myelin-oligodendrocyte glycoprotein-like [Anoplopoma fimbria]|uniref:myelin-oligodendrocyte glycoprotein-like n=1 Tax=Anoplopoma fimbria TaxID=229290 RepID=UPI0023ED4A61|nr:myelin-oligodendrocyte glycoprotein-like [Anoplopoma fimbria]